MEHSLEVQIPFLQVVLQDFKILPVVTGECSVEILRGIAELFVRFIEGKKVLFIASSDLSHYHPYEEAVEIDKRGLKAIEKLDGRLFLQGVGERRYEFCGAYAVATVMFIARYLGATEVQLLKYANSGDVPFGNRSRVVGYSAIAFLKRSGSETVSKLKEDTVNIYRSLTEEEQKILLKIALEAIRT